MQICEICLNNFKTLQCMTESCQQNRFELAIGLKQVKRLAYKQIQLEKAMDNPVFYFGEDEGYKKTLSIIERRCINCKGVFFTHLTFKKYCNGSCREIFQTNKKNGIII